jgi:hypothetical protein
VLAAVCAYPALAADRIGGPLAIAGGAACLALLVGLAGRWGPLVQVGLALALGSYAAALVEVGDFDPWAPLVGAGLLLAGELAYTSVEPPARRSWPFSVGTVAAAALLGALLLGAAGGGSGGIPELTLGVGAAAAALAVLAWVASRPNARQR